MKNRLLVLAVMIGVFFGAFPPVFGQFFFGIKAGGMFYQPNGNLFNLETKPGFDVGVSFKFRKWDRIAFLVEPGFAIVDGGSEVILDLNNPPKTCRFRHKALYMDTQLKFDLTPEGKAAFYAGPGIFSIMQSNVSCEPDSTASPSYELFERLHPYFKMGFEFRTFRNGGPKMPDFRLSFGIFYDYQRSIVPSGINFALKYYVPNKQVTTLHTQ